MCAVCHIGAFVANVTIWEAELWNKGFLAHIDSRATTRDNQPQWPTPTA